VKIETLYEISELLDLIRFTREDRRIDRKNGVLTVESRRAYSRKVEHCKQKLSDLTGINIQEFNGF